jgi:hypothetical protein
VFTVVVAGAGGKREDGEGSMSDSFSAWWFDHGAEYMVKPPSCAAEAAWIEAKKTPPCMPDCEYYDRGVCCCSDSCIRDADDHYTLAK